MNTPIQRQSRQNPTCAYIVMNSKINVPCGGGKLVVWWWLKRISKTRILT